MSENKSTLITTGSEREQNQHMERYYRFQSKIYDFTRWSFLFGRRHLIRELPLGAGKQLNMLEVGCGTGYNLHLLARRFPRARITGMDVSPDMVRLARRRAGRFGDRLKVIGAPYGPGAVPSDSLDLILFSYALTMINPQWAELLRQAAGDLRPGGLIAVVDFHDSRYPWFKRHMSNHHVRMDGHLLPLLQELFQEEKMAVGQAYGGVWTYLSFLGSKC